MPNLGLSLRSSELREAVEADKASWGMVAGQDRLNNQCWFKARASALALHPMSKFERSKRQWVSTLESGEQRSREIHVVPILRRGTTPEQYGPFDWFKVDMHIAAQGFLTDRMGTGEPSAWISLLAYTGQRNSVERQGVNHLSSETQQLQRI